MEGGKLETKEVNSTQINKGQKRCKRCSLFLNADEWEQTKCIYHPGTYKELAGKDWDSGWSCCRKELSSTLQISDFKKYQAPMPPLPKMPTVKEYLHEATRKAASQFDEIMKQQQGPSISNVNNSQPRLEFATDSTPNPNVTPNQNENINVQMPNGDVINVDFSSLPESSVYSYSVSPVDVDVTPVVSVPYSVTPVTVSSNENEENEVEEIDVTPTLVQNVNINQNNQHQHQHQHHDQSNEVLSSPRLSNTFDSPITSTDSSPSVHHHNTHPVQRSTSPEVIQTGNLNENSNSIVSVTEQSNSIVSANNLNLPPQSHNPRYHTHSSIVLNNGNASIVEVDPNANHVLIPFDNLTYVQKNQLLQQWDNQVVEYYIGKRHEKEDDKTMTLDEKMRFRDDPMLSPFSKESIGCTILAHHVEDLEYSNTIANFPIVNTEENQRRHVLPQEILQKKLGDTRNPLPEGLLSITYSPPSSPPPSSSSPPPYEESNVTPSEKEEVNEDDLLSSSDEEGLTEEEKEKKRKKKEKIPDFFIHKIETGDTLVGISLKYGVVVEDLLRINFLNRSNLLQISHLKQVKVPTNGKSVPRQTIKKPSKNEIIQEFVRKTKSTSEEAKYYLEENSWDVDEAAEEYQKDKEWEKENESKYKGSKFLEPLPIGREAKEDFKRKNCLCVK